MALIRAWMAVTMFWNTSRVKPFLSASLYPLPWMILICLMKVLFPLSPVPRQMRWIRPKDEKWNKIKAMPKIGHLWHAHTQKNHLNINQLQLYRISATKQQQKHCNLNIARIFSDIKVSQVLIVFFSLKAINVCVNMDACVCAVCYVSVGNTSSC